MRSGAGVVAARLVAVGLRDHCPRNVGDDELKHAAIEAQRARRRFKAVGHCFTRRGAGVCLAGSAQVDYEDVGQGVIGQADG